MPSLASIGIPLLSEDVLSGRKTPYMPDQNNIYQKRFSNKKDKCAHVTNNVFIIFINNINNMNTFIYILNNCFLLYCF